MVDNVSDAPIGRGQPININEADVNIASARAVRLNPSTGDPVSAEEDLLRDVRSSVDSETSTLQKEFNQLRGQMTELIDAVKSQARLASTGGGGGGAEGAADAMKEMGSPASIANIRASVKGFHNVSTVLDLYETKLMNMAKTEEERKQAIEEEISTIKDEERKRERHTQLLRENNLYLGEFVKDMGKLVKSGFLVQFRRNLEELPNELFRMGESLGDFRGAFSDVKRDLQEYDQLLKSGQVSLDDFVTQLGSGVRGLMSLDATVEAMNKSMQANAVTPFVTFGNTLHEVRQNLFDFRETLEAQGFDWASAMDTTEMSAAMIELVGIERRSSLQSGIENITTRRSTFEQLQLMREIAFSTGKSLDQLIDINRKTAEELSELEALGAVSQTTRQNAQNLINFLKAQGPEGDAVAQSIMSSLQFGEQGLAVAMSKDANLRILMQQNPEFREVFQRLTAGKQMNLQDTLAPLQSLQARGGITLPDIKAFEGIGADRRQLGGVAAGVNAIFTNFDDRMAAFQDAQEGTFSGLDDTFREFRDFMKQNLPDAATNMLILATAIGANIFALGKNTLALLGGGGSIGGRGRGGVGRAAATIGGTAGAAGAARFAAGGGSLAGATTSMGAQIGPAVAAQQGGRSGFRLPSIGPKGGSLAAIAAGMLAEPIGQAVGGDTGGEIGSVAGDVIGMAGTGALIGSFIPGIGTAIGAGIGGLVGLGMNASNIEQMFSGDVPKTTGVGPMQAAIPRAPTEGAAGRAMVTMLAKDVNLQQEILRVLMEGNEISQGIKSKIGFDGGSSTTSPTPGGRPPRPQSIDMRGKKAPFAEKMPAAIS